MFSAQSLFPIVEQLPKKEQRNLLSWLQTELEEVEEPKDDELTIKLKRMIDRSRIKNKIKKCKQS